MDINRFNIFPFWGHMQIYVNIHSTFESWVNVLILYNTLVMTKTKYRIKAILCQEYNLVKKTFVPFKYLVFMH